MERRVWRSVVIVRPPDRGEGEGEGEGEGGGIIVLLMCGGYVVTLKRCTNSFTFVGIITHFHQKHLHRG